MSTSPLIKKVIELIVVILDDLDSRYHFDGKAAEALEKIHKILSGKVTSDGIDKL